MWWKLIALGCATIVLIVSLIPIRTHAVIYDPLREPPPPRPSFSEMVSNMYLTRGTLAVIVAILVAAAFVALKIVRRQW